MANYTLFRRGILVLFLTGWACSSVLDTIKSYKGFNYEYSFRSLLLQKEGKARGYTNLLASREERKEEIRLGEEGGMRVQIHAKGAGDWEYLKEKGSWEKRPRSEGTDLIRILEIFLANNPQFGETIFLPNLIFLGSFQSQGMGKIRYRKGRITEISARDSLTGVEFYLKLSGHNRVREIKIPFFPAMEVIFSTPKGKEVLGILRRRLDCLKINYELKIKGERGTLKLEEKVEEEILELLFAVGEFNIYQGEEPLSSGESAKLSVVPNGILLALPPELNLSQPENLLLRVDGKLSFPLAVDIWEKESKMKILKLELWGKKMNLLFSVLSERLPYPIDYEER